MRLGGGGLLLGEGAGQDQDGLGNSRRAQAQGLLDPGHGETIRRRQGRGGPLQAVAIGIRLDDGPDAAGGGPLARHPQVVTQGRQVDQGVGAREPHR